MSSYLPPFHLAIPVADIVAAREFYGGLLGCAEGRSSDTWVDFSLYGHQFVVHLVPGYRAEKHYNPVDSHQVPVPHFGVVLSLEDWRALANRLVAAGQEFAIEPTTRFAGGPGEQSTMFFCDPSGNALEFKAFADVERQLFAK